MGGGGGTCGVNVMDDIFRTGLGEAYKNKHESRNIVYTFNLQLYT